MTRMKPTPGKYHDVPFEQYLAWDAVSVHDLMLVARSPAHFQAIREKPPEPTAAMRFGTAAHAWILFDAEAADHVVVAPKVDRRTKAGKEAWADFEAMAGNRVVISEDEARHLARMKAAIYDSPAAKGLLDMADEREVSCAWEDAESGLLCRGRPDAMGNGVIIDLKTSADARPREFAKTAANFNYDAQAAYYLDGLTSNGLAPEGATFVFIVVEKLPPYGVAVYALDADAMENGRRKYRSALETYASCRTTNAWPAYNEAKSITSLSLPRWAFND